MAKNNYVTLRDLAKECGVSATTVSLALRDHPRISDATKKKVKDMAEKMGYRRHPMLTALMTNLSQVKNADSLIPIAVVYTHDASRLKGNTFHSRVWDGMNERAKQLGFKLEAFFPKAEGVSWKRLSDIFKARGINGILMPPLKTPNMKIPLDWKNFSVVSIGYSMDEPDFNRVCPDQYQAIQIVIKKVNALGYKRIGLVLNHQTDQRVHRLWSSGYYGHQVIETDEIIPVLENGTGKDGVVSASDFKKWYNKYQPEVIVSSDLEILPVMKQCKLRYPDDVGLVTLSGLEEGCDIAGIHQNARTIGSAAMEKLAELIYYNRSGEPDLARVLLIPSRWKMGTSLRDQSC